MAGVTFADELVRDYLVFRGFLTTLKAFDAEIKADKDRGFRPDKIVEHLSTCINNLDLKALREAWSHLDQRIFCRLEYSFLGTARKLETALLRMYLITCVSSNRPDRLLEFFEKMTPELQGQVEWKEWFALPFLKNVEENPTFSVYFSRQWQDTMLLSLHNFISVVFQSMALPTLLSYEEELIRITSLQEENEMLKKKIASMQDGSFEPQKNASEDDSKEIPTIPEPMDDFCVIAQEVPSENSGRSIKTLIRNISSGIPTSPILGRRQHDSRKTEDGHSATGSSKTSKVKPRSPSVPPHSHSSTSATKESPLLKQEGEVTTKANLSKEDHSVHGPDKKTSVSGAKTVSSASQPSCPSIPTITDTKSGFLILSQEEYSEHLSFITHCKFNSTGSVVASADMDSVIKVWNASPSPQTLSTIMCKSSVLALEWSSKRDKLLLHSASSGCVRLYDIKERKVVGEVSVESSPSSSLKTQCIECSPTEAGFVVSSCSSEGGVLQGQLGFWDMRTLQVLHRLPLASKNSYVHCCSFNHNGQLLLAGTSDGSTCIFDLRSAERIATWASHAGSVFTAQFSTDETTCYTIGKDGKFFQWSVNKTGHRVAELAIHSGATGPFSVKSGSILCDPVGKLFVFNNDGSHILTCGLNGGMIYKVSKNSIAPGLNISGHKLPVTTVDWYTAMECSTCLCGSADGKITVSTLLAQ